MNIAIVTGAGSGMGKDFVEILDKEGLDEIWAISLHGDRFENLKLSCKTKLNCIAIDLSVHSNLIKIKKMIDEQMPTICWLINAAGFGKFNYYENIKTETSLNMIDLNIKAMVELTDICLPYIKSGGRIVDFSSLSAFQPVPYANIYSATKAFILSYSRALNYELKHRKISVTCICPFWTYTNFFKRAVDKQNKVINKYIAFYTSKDVVKKAYKDSLKRKPLSIYGFISNLQVFLTKILPANLIIKIWLKQQNK